MSIVCVVVDGLVLLHGLVRLHGLWGGFKGRRGGV